MAQLRRASLLALTVLVAAACGGADRGGPAVRRPGTGAPVPTASSAPVPSGSPDAPAGTLVVAVGDIACPRGSKPGTECRHAETARLAEQLDPEAVLALGDLVYPGGSPTGFVDAYAPSWGRLKARTHPAPGNHEYLHPGAKAYFDYWGARAGPGWYALDLGSWHIVSLNGSCERVGCGPDSAQGRWLTSDLAASRSRCTLAFWHQPRWSSGLHGSDHATEPLWDAVHAARADVVLGGHDHHYERFAPLSVDGRPVRPGQGTRQFVVGTGGRSLYPVVRDPAGSEKIVATAYGVLALRLLPTAYSWEFVSVDGEVLDSGSSPCR